MHDLKEAAGRKAAELAQDGMTLGLGTGSTVHFALVRLAERIAGENLRLRGVPTSLATESEARELGIPIVSLDKVERIDLTIDGADEIDPNFDMIKRGWAASPRCGSSPPSPPRPTTGTGSSTAASRAGSPTRPAWSARSRASRAWSRAGSSSGSRTSS